MLVAKSIEDESVFGYESISIHWSPFNFSRLNTPRKRVKLKIKKAIAFKKGILFESFV